MSDLAARIAGAIGTDNVLVSAQAMAPHLVELRDLYRGAAQCVACPATPDEVAQILHLARDAGASVVPQGGNTGLVGGAVPDMSGRQIVLSLRRMNRIRKVDPASDSMIVEAGVTLAAARAAAQSVDRLFPISLASQDLCTIGGNLASNAGGLQVLSYGNARDLVLGLEVVLADGQVWNGLRTLRKDNSGYDLKNLFIGSEGTLGVITAAALKLVPRPRHSETAIAGVPDLAAALALFHRARARFGAALTSAEFLPRAGLEMVLHHIPGARDPFTRSEPWYVLLETSLDALPSDGGPMAALLAEATKAGETGRFVIAIEDAPRRALWLLRESMSQAQRPEGGSIKHDVSVPLAAIPDFIAEATQAAHMLVPDCRPVPFGHLGDGNVHFNISQPVAMDRAAFIDLWPQMNARIHAVAVAFDGSIAAEHGVGRLKRDLLPGVKDPVELDLMRRMKQALDPDGLLNPGIVLPAEPGR